MTERATTRAAARPGAARTAGVGGRLWLVTLGLVLFGAAIALVQSARAQDEEQFEPLTQAELEQLVGPIALYPDEILSVILPASTYPLQIVEAARFLDERESNPDAVADDDWDDSVVALLNYPEVVRLMNNDLDWTWMLGQAVLDDQAAVLDAVQTFRGRAYAAGNLATDDKQVVTQDDSGVITIEPAEPEVVYIPYYEPERVVIYQPYPVFHYYPFGYPLYYYPYPVGYRFNLGFFWGVTSAFSIGWHSHFLHVYDYARIGHPYYGSTYYLPFYRRNSVHVTVNVNNSSNVWRPSARRGARPYDGYRSRTTEGGGRVYDGRRYTYRDGTREGTRDTSRRAASGGQAGTAGGRTRDQRSAGGPTSSRTDPRAGNRGGTSQVTPQTRRGSTGTNTGDATTRTPRSSRETPRSSRDPADGRTRQQQTAPTRQQQAAPGRSSTQRGARPAPRTRQRTLPSQPSDQRSDARTPGERQAPVNGGSRFAGVAPSARPQTSRPSTRTAEPPTRTLQPSARAARPQTRTLQPSARSSGRAAARPSQPRSSSTPSSPAPSSSAPSSSARSSSRLGGVASRPRASAPRSSSPSRSSAPATRAPRSSAPAARAPRSSGPSRQSRSSAPARRSSGSGGRSSGRSSRRGR